VLDRKKVRKQKSPAQAGFFLFGVFASNNGFHGCDHEYRAVLIRSSLERRVVHKDSEFKEGFDERRIF